MTLRNLLATRQLHEHEADPVEVHLLLNSTSTALKDASQVAVSAQSRFDMAYRAIMQCAMVALWANGFRPSKSTPGHHAVMIQTLSKSIGLRPEQVKVLDAFRNKRNAADYQGKEIDDASVAACIEAAGKLRALLISWLRKNRPELIEKNDIADN